MTNSRAFTMATGLKANFMAKQKYNMEMAVSTTEVLRATSVMETGD